MTPGQIIALIKDLAIVVTLGLAIWLLISYGKDIVKVSDMKAVQKQLAQNAITEAQWRQEQEAANAQRDTQLAQVGAAIANQHAPVLVCRSPNPGPVPSVPAATADAHPGIGGTDTGPGGGDKPIDIRPAINAFELKYETALADCRAAIASWPQ